MSTLEEIISQWDGEQTILHRDAPTGAMIVVAIHSSRRGTPSGGTRMQIYPDLVKAVQDAHNLSAGMTFKFAVAGLNRGGGKAVISCRPNLMRRSAMPCLGDTAHSSNVWADFLKPARTWARRTGTWM